jgi:hypothetical protein
VWRSAQREEIHPFGQRQYVALPNHLHEPANPDEWRCGISQPQSDKHTNEQGRSHGAIRAAKLRSLAMIYARCASRSPDLESGFFDVELEAEES